jgi:uncharacterized C2H2 Zn-finger protein
MRFKKIGFMNRHRNAHFVSYSCTRCDKAFLRQDDLDEHVKKEHKKPEKKKKCSWCKVEFLEGKVYDKHVLKQCKKKQTDKKKHGKK